MKSPKLHKKNILRVTDLSKEEMYSLFDFTEQLKKAQKSGEETHLLRNKTLAMIFEKNSTRTRVSFEVGMYQLGGSALFLSKNEIQLSRGESVADTAKILSRYVDGIMIRTDAHSKITEIANVATVPVINGLTDFEHPCQALADFFTMYERNKKLEKQKLVYIGDSNNVANSLLLGSAILGIDIAIVSPKEYLPAAEVMEEAQAFAKSSGSTIVITSDILSSVENADYLYTDVWTSMGQEEETAKRKKDFADFKISSELMKKCPPHCKVMHCLPAHRGEEIDADVIDSDSSIIFEQAENRLHAQKALLCALMK